MADDSPRKWASPDGVPGGLDSSLGSEYFDAGFDDEIIALYARSMSARGIQGHVREFCGIEAPPTWPRR